MYSMLPQDRKAKLIPLHSNNMYHIAESLGNVIELINKINIRIQCMKILLLLILMCINSRRIYILRT